MQESQDVKKIEAKLAKEDSKCNKLINMLPSKPETDSAIH
jgi:hypothetical protein